MQLKLPVGLMLCSMALLLHGLAFLVTGILFFGAPASLRDEGFRQDGTLGIRVALLLAFAGVGLLLAWNAWKLIHLSASALQKARAFALGIAAVFVTRIADDGAGSPLNWLGVVVALAVAGYLSLPSIRDLFRPQSG